MLFHVARTRWSKLRDAPEHQDNSSLPSLTDPFDRKISEIIDSATEGNIAEIKHWRGFPGDRCVAV
jgi:hypothetical protein